MPSFFIWKVTIDQTPFGQSLARQAAVTDRALSPLWAERSLGRRLDVLRVPLEDARKVAKDLDGNDNAAGEGADEYTYNLALNQFNTSTFTTVSIPLSQFTLSEHVPRTDANFGSGPGGFTNAGDELLEDFNLYEFGGLIPGNGGLLRLELDYMEI